VFRHGSWLVSWDAVRSRVATNTPKRCDARPLWTLREYPDQTHLPAAFMGSCGSRTRGEPVFDKVFMESLVASLGTSNMWAVAPHRRRLLQIPWALTPGDNRSVVNVHWGLAFIAGWLKSAFWPWRRIRCQTSAI